MTVKPEILAPAGDFTCLQAAIDAGADAVYFGLGTFNMRARSGVNFREGDLPEIRRRCEAVAPARAPVRRYLTLNAIMFEGEAAEIERVIEAAKPYVDAFIVSDWGVVSLCRRHGVKFHVSTQMSTSNSMAVRFLAEQGASRVVLARECTLEEVRSIYESIQSFAEPSKTPKPPEPIQLECFVHGAQCVAESGRCFMSHDVFGKSACRGECVQPCRRRFLVKAVDLYEDSYGRPVHPDARASYVVEPHTVLSARDLCSLPFVDKLVAAGIASFKIEGRARNANYVKTVTAAYRRAVDAVAAGEFTPALVDELVKSVKTVFHREFSEGLYFGRPGVGQFADSEDSRATTVKRHIGVVIDYFLQAQVAQVKVQDHEIRPGDPIQIHGPTTGVAELTVGELWRDDERLDVCGKGGWATFKAPRCRVGDKVFFVERTASAGEGAE